MGFFPAGPMPDPATTRPESSAAASVEADNETAYCRSRTAAEGLKRPTSATRLGGVAPVVCLQSTHRRTPRVLLAAQPQNLLAGFDALRSIHGRMQHRQPPAQQTTTAPRLSAVPGR